MKEYGIDHHSRAIVSILHLFVEKELPSFPDYLSSRLIQTEKIKKITKGKLKKEKNDVPEVMVFRSATTKMIARLVNLLKMSKNKILC